MNGSRQSENVYPMSRSSWALSNRVALLGLTLIVAVGAGLRIYGLNSGLWYDEIVTLVASVRHPLSSIVTHFPGNNDHPLYSVFARLTIVVFGEQPWALRLPAVIFGIASLPMLYVFGTRVTSRVEALSATALLAVSYHPIWFSQNARGYTLLLFCALLATNLLLIGMRDNYRAAYVAYAVVSALGAYTHLTMVLVTVAQAGVVGCHLLGRHRGRIILRDWFNPAIGFFLAALLTLILYAPVLFDVQSFFGQKSVGASVTTASWALWETLRGLQLGYMTSGALLVGGLLFVAGCWSYLRQSPILLALFVAPGAVLLGVAILLHRPIFPRFFFFLAGFALLIVVRGAWVIGEWAAARIPIVFLREDRRRLLPGVVIAGLILLSMLALPRLYRFPKQDYGRALRYLEANAGPGDLIAIAGAGTAFPYRSYFGRPWRRIGNGADLTKLCRRYKRVWIVYTFQMYLEQLEPNLMHEMRRNCVLVKTFPGTVPGGSIAIRRCGE